MSTAVRALEYDIDAQGRVHTRGQYRVVTQGEWDEIAPYTAPRYLPYDRLLRDLEAGRIVAVPCHDRRRALHVRATLRQRARHWHMILEDKVARVASEPEEWTLLARKHTTDA